MPRTAETGYVLLPTPTASDGLQGGIIGKEDTFRTTESGTLRKVNKNGIDGSIGLGRLVQMWVGTPTAQMSSKGRSEKFREGRTPNPVEFAKMWPTPTTPRPHDSKNTAGKYIPSQKQFDLAAAVTMWSTPTASEWKGRGPNSKQQGLAEEVKLWPTHTTDSATQRTKKYKQGGTPLELAVMVPTPTSRAWKPPSNCKNRQGTADIQTVVQMYPTPTVGAPLCGGSHAYEQLKRMEGNGNITSEERSSMASKSGGQLNPDWVEWLMGVPAGWTDIEKDMPLPEYDPHWYDAEPDIPRVANGVANRVDRLKGLGNMVDPYQFFPVTEAIATILRGLKDGVS